jgi:hypothetical protein
VLPISEMVGTSSRTRRPETTNILRPSLSCMYDRAMATSFTIFYSWESDLPNSTNRGFIQGELEAVAKEVTAEGAAVVEVDRDTTGVAGSPDIGKTILSKIDAANAFVADLSIINSEFPADRKTPNPNVVFELGWAFKSLGENRVVTVMNTAFGIPEHLPFDLKQRRTVKYELPAGEDKTEARKALRRQLVSAIKAIVEQGEKERASRTPVSNPTKEMVDAIEASRPNQFAVAKRFMRGLTERLLEIDAESKTTGGTPEERLLRAIEASKDIVNNFGTVVRAAAETGSQDAVHGVVQGFEFLLARYELQGAGSFSTSDFDLYKFAGHEFMAVLAAHLIRAERWSMFPSLFGETIHHGRYPGPVGLHEICSNVELLDRLSRSRQRISVHADLLKERHEATPPVGDVTFAELMASDLMLYLGAGPWFPWSAIFIADRVPRFLSAAATPDGARALAAALGSPILLQMKIDVTRSLKGLQQNLANMGAWRPWRFDPATIFTGP